MLQTIKRSIYDKKTEDFGVFFQKYVLQVESEMLASDVQSIEHRCNSLDCTPQILSGVDILTKELKELC